MPTISTNNELLNVINEDVKSIKEWSNMPAISEELYNELPKNLQKYLDIDLVIKKSDINNDS